MIKYCGQTSIICIIIMLSEFYILKSRINFPVTLGFVESIIVQLASWGGGGKGRVGGEALWMEHEYSACFWLPCLFLCFSFLGNKLKTRFTWQKKKECSWKITVRIWLFSECWPSSETQGQLVGSIKCLWWKFTVRSSRTYSKLSPRTFYRPD